MRAIILFLIIVSGSFSTVYSQEIGCSCEQALQQLIGKVETGYPGFADKTTDKFVYQSLKDSLQADSRKAGDSACLSVLQKYVVFFKDPHLLISAKGAGNPSNSAAPGESVEVNIDDFVRTAPNSVDKLEGIWANSSYKIGLKKTGTGEYVGFIIESTGGAWQPKEIKLRLYASGSSEYAMMDRSIKKGTYSVFDSYILRIDAVNAVFVKQSPILEIDAKLRQSKLDEVEGFYFKRLTAKTSILKISSFNYPDLERVKNLIQQSKSLLESTENLILDIRGNPGGTDDVYTELLPYLMTNPYRSLMGEFLATQDYIDQLEDYIKSIKEPEKEKAEIARVRKQIDVMKANLGKFVGRNDFDKDAEPVSIVKVVPAAKSPRQVVVLADKGVGSAAENFLIAVKQSKKVKVLGTPSYGGLDYGNAYWISIGCENYQVFMPTYRATRLPEFPIDNIGIQPDVYLDPSVKDWLAYAIRYLED